MLRSPTDGIVQVEVPQHLAGAPPVFACRAADQVMSAGSWSASGNLLANDIEG